RGRRESSRRLRRVAEIATDDPAVGVDAAVPQERPAAPHLLDPCEIHLREDDRFPVSRCLRHDGAERIGDEGRSPELESLRRGAFGALAADPVYRRHVAPVRDRVAALDGAPRVELLLPVGVLLGRVPADRRGIEQHVGALQRGVPPAPAPRYWAPAPVRRDRTGPRPRAVRSTASETAPGGTPARRPPLGPLRPSRSPWRGSRRDRRTSTSVRARWCIASAATRRSWGRTVQGPSVLRQTASLLELRD